MKKKLLSLALVLAMALTLLPTAAFAFDVEADKCTHKGDGTTGDETKVAQSQAEQSANCTTDGCKAYYQCALCGTYFSDAAGSAPISNLETWKKDEKGGLLKKTGHSAAPTNQNDWSKDANEHSYTCSKCSQKVAVAHNYGTGEGANTCTVCGYKKTTTEQPKAPTVKSVSGTFTATKATVNFVIENAAADTKVTVTLKKDGQAEGSPATVGADAAKAEFTLKDAAKTDKYTADVAISGGQAAAMTATLTWDSGSNIVVPPTPTTPETPAQDPNKAPSNDSQGIPMASEVSSPQQAQAAINTLKNTDAAALSNRLLSNESAAASFQALDYAVQNAKGVRVTVDVDRSSAPSAVRSGVSVTGAAFNASTTNSTVSLVVDAPSQAYSVTSGYQISMTMTGVPSAAKLDVPVLITLPLPSDVRSDRVVVLHYHNGSSTPATIVPAVSGSSIRFTVTGFSDFVVTDKDASVARPGNNTGYVSGNAGKVNTGNTLDSATLAAIAGMLSGNGVFVDVPENHWAAKEIRWARDGGLMSGYGNGYFSPNASTTRQQLWMVLARLSGTRPADMAVARQWAINTGVSDGSDPTGILSRQQLVTMLYRFAKSQGVNVSASAKLGGYADGAKVASYAKDAMNWAVGKGIVTGSGSKLNPEGTATRAHFAVFLYRYSHI